MPDPETPLLPIPAPSEKLSPLAKSFLLSFIPLSLISFGGPQAHVGLFHRTFVQPTPGATPKLSEPTFLELYALSQSLPGPGSTQLAVSLGATFGGPLLALLTFLIWHLPGFFAMAAAGVWFHSHLANAASVGKIQWLVDHAVGLIAAAFSFVLLAAFKIVSAVCANDPLKMAIALASMFVAVTIPPAASSWVFIVLLVAGGVVYFVVTAVSARGQDVDAEERAQAEVWESQISPAIGVGLLLLVLALTIAIALLPAAPMAFRLLKIFWRIGLSVFGGGIVVVPMLLNEFVESGLLPTSVFLAGFGLFGCIPGPMFNLAPFLGAAVLSWPGAFCGSFGLFGPGILLQVALLPFWERLRKVRTARTVLQGTNAAAAGLIVAGVWMLLRKTFVGPAAFALTCTAGAMAVTFQAGPAVNIVLHGIVGALIVYLGIGGPYRLVDAG